MMNARIHEAAGRIPAKAANVNDTIDVAFDVFDMFFWLFDLMNVFLDFMRNVGDYISGQ